MKNKILKAALSVVLVAVCMLGCFSASAEESGMMYEEGDKELVAVTAVLTTDPADNDAKILKISIKNNSFDKKLTSQLVFSEDEIGLGYEASQLYEVMPGTVTEVKVKLGEDFDLESTPKLSYVFLYRVSPANNQLLQEDYTVYGIEYSDVLAAQKVTPKDVIKNFLNDTGFVKMFGNIGKGLSGAGSAFENFVANYGTLVMILIACILLYLAIGKGFEPLLLMPIAFGMLLTNLPGADMFHEVLFSGGHVHWDLFPTTAGLLDYLYLGVKLGIYPCLIFMGVGAMTDFGPLIANPKSLLLGAAAQFGIFATYIGAMLSGQFTAAQASSIGIIGGADGPTAIFVTSKLAPELLGPIAVAAYSYMALVPVIQPPIMKLLTTKKERQIVMKPLRTVSKKEKMVFPIVVTVFVALLVPSAAPLVGCLMLGNLFRESGVADRLSKTAQNELMNIVTIFLGVTVGATATAGTFLSVKTLLILAMGIVAFSMGTAAGVILAKVMNLFTKKNKINPLIGSAGVSAVPMAARVSQVVGQKENPKNFLLMHAMGPNVAGVIGSAIAAGVLLALFG